MFRFLLPLFQDETLLKERGIFLLSLFGLFLKIERMKISYLKVKKFFSDSLFQTQVSLAPARKTTGDQGFSGAPGFA